ncbi:hypothetical protein IV500_04420 [Paeniglutamicibacter antarcticus]|uniref:Uncharacterized protein n=1 Tax=Arthrobacter terrae TaxID=2935737 RepID=A0A931CM27_9MICC|nr:hypothetical protein [Arthrobacter terrae]MBG0738665.1 hypothetical protein [Arthrobacter terrae]
MDEYIPLQARVNPDGSVDVLIDSAAVPGGSGLTMASLLQLLTRYARENGKLMMTTTHPNGSVTRDLVSEAGEITPFYPEAGPQSVKAAVSADPSEEALLQVLKQSGQRRVGYSEIATAPPVAAAPATTRVTMGEGAIPKFDVEADIQKAMSSKKPPASTKQRIIIALVITVLVLVAVALAGMPLLNAAAHMLGALPAPGVPATGLLQI